MQQVQHINPELNHYDRIWGNETDIYWELMDQYPSIMSIIDWLYGIRSVVSNDADLAMITKAEDGTVHVYAPDQGGIDKQDIELINSIVESGDQMQVWEGVYSFKLTNYIFIHRRLNESNGTCLLGFLIPKSEETQTQVLDVQSRFIQKRWFQ